jgi:hypothetical protein
MLYEDAHWADPTSLDALDQLIDRLRTIPLLLVITHRPEFQPRWTGHGHVVALTLSKLTRAQSNSLIAVDFHAILTHFVGVFSPETDPCLYARLHVKLGGRRDQHGSARQDQTVALSRWSGHTRDCREDLVIEEHGTQIPA